MLDSEYKIKFLSENETNIWTDLIKSSFSTIFHSYDWLSAYRECFGNDFKLVILTKKQNILGGCVAFPITKMKRKISTLPTLNYYNGIIFNEKVAILNTSSERKRKLEFTNEIANFLENEFGWIFLSHQPNLNDIRAFNDRNWEVKIRYTLKNTLVDEETLFLQIRNVRRRHIKKATNSNCEVKEFYDFEESYKLQLDARIKGGIKFDLPKENFIRFLEALNKKKLIKSYFAFSSSGEPLANWILGIHKNSLYSLVSGVKRGTFPEANHIGTFLKFKVLSNEELRKNFLYLDFIGANTPGVREFKGDFGGELVPFYQTEFTNSNLLKSARFIKSKILCSLNFQNICRKYNNTGYNQSRIIEK